MWIYVGHLTTQKVLDIQNEAKKSGSDCDFEGNVPVTGGLSDIVSSRTFPVLFSDAQSDFIHQTQHSFKLKKILLGCVGRIYKISNLKQVGLNLLTILTVIWRLMTPLLKSGLREEEVRLKLSVKYFYWPSQCYCLQDFYNKCVWVAIMLATTILLMPEN